MEILVPFISLIASAYALLLSPFSLERSMKFRNFDLDQSAIRLVEVSSGMTSVTKKISYFSFDSVF